MLRGGGDSFGDHLLVDDRCGEELPADVLELADGGRVHRHPPPAPAGPVEDGPHQAEAAPLAGEATCLTDRPLVIRR